MLGAMVVAWALSYESWATPIYTDYGDAVDSRLPTAVRKDDSKWYGRWLTMMVGIGNDCYITNMAGVKVVANGSNEFVCDCCE